MRSFRVTWPWLLGVCGGAAFALSIMTGGPARALEADPTPPVGIEAADPASASPAAPAPLADVDPQAEADHFDTGDDGQYSTYRYDYPEDPSGSYNRAEGNFAYPEEYFYKYGYHYYNYVDPQGKYGYNETGDQTNTEANAETAVAIEPDHIGEIGNTANFSHERDWENEPYDFGDGTTAQLYEVANGLTATYDAWSPETSSPYEYDYGTESPYGYQYGTRHDDTAYPYGYDGDYANEQSWNHENSQVSEEANSDSAMDEHADGEAEYKYEDNNDESANGETMTDEAEYEYNGDESANDEAMTDEAEYEYNNDESANDEAMTDEAEYEYNGDESANDEAMTDETQYEYNDENYAYEPAEQAASETNESSDNQATDEAADSHTYGYEYGYGAEYGYDSEFGNDPQHGYQAESGDTTEDMYSECPEEGYDCPRHTENETPISSTEDTSASSERTEADENQMTESPESYYQNKYGYEYDYGYGEAYGEASTADEEQRSWNEYGYEYSCPEEKYGYPQETSEMAAEPVDETSETSVPATTELETNHEAEYGFDSRYEGEPGELIDYSQWNQPYSYEYAEPYDYYGEEQTASEPAQAETSNEQDYCRWPEGEEMAQADRESTATMESGLELFSWRPSELLAPPDQQTLRTLETLCEEPSGSRRSVLNDHLEGMGFEAIDFASRFEDVTGMEALGLADDLPGAAAFLACFRLVEQGELGMDEAVDLLRRSLQRPSMDWIEGVREITAGAFDDWDGMPASLENDAPQSDDTTSIQPLSDVMASLVSRSWDRVQGTLASVADQVSQWDLESWIAGLQERLAEAEMASDTATF